MKTADSESGCLKEDLASGRRAGGCEQEVNIRWRRHRFRVPSHGEADLVAIDVFDRGIAPGAIDGTYHERISLAASQNTAHVLETRVRGGKGVYRRLFRKEDEVHGVSSGTAPAVPVATKKRFGGAVIARLPMLKSGRLRSDPGKRMADPFHFFGEYGVGAAGKSLAGHGCMVVQKDTVTFIDKCLRDVGILLGASEQDRSLLKVDRNPRCSQRSDQGSAQSSDKGISPGMAKRVFESQAGPLREPDESHPFGGESGPFEAAYEVVDDAESFAQVRLVFLDWNEESPGIPGSGRGGRRTPMHAFGRNHTCDSGNILSR